MKILGSDFDGTFAAGGIDERKLAAVARWQEAGHKFGIISGRGGDFLPYITGLYPRLRLDFYAACNGAYIVDGAGVPIYETVCREVTVGELLAELYGMSSIVYIKIGEQCLRPVTELTGEADEILLADASRLGAFHCFSVCFPTAEAVAPTAARMKEAYGAWLSPLPNGRWIDLVPRGVNKAEGLRRVMAHYGASHADVIAVGDDGNDLDMIREFRSYAMAGGIPALKALAAATVQDVTELIERELSASAPLPPI